MFHLVSASRSLFDVRALLVNKAHTVANVGGQDGPGYVHFSIDEISILIGTPTTRKSATTSNEDVRQQPPLD